MMVLQTKGLSVSFGAVRANDEVDIDVPAGMCVGLIGPNGAGKTTFIDSITGFVALSAGEVHFCGERIDGLPSHRRSRLGLVRTFQSLELFEELTVRDNLVTAAEQSKWYVPFIDLVRPNRVTDAHRAADRALEVLELGSLADSLPSELSHGTRKLVSLARAVAARPRLLLLDEPAAGLDTSESQALGRLLRRLVDDGITILLVDHDMGLVLNVCDHVYVLDFGRIIADGSPDHIRDNPAVIAAYLGSTATASQEDAARRARSATEPPT